MSTVTRNARIEPLDPPCNPEIEETLGRMMPPGVEPLKLFRTVAKNPAILDRFRTTGAYILNFGRVEPLEREILIHRTTARCRCEYEWGVHAAFFPAAVGLSPQQIEATVTGSANDPVWSSRQALLVRLADELHESSTVSDELWAKLAAGWDEEQLVELFATVGFYHLVSFVANAAQVQLEPFGSRFPD
jgi:4-carboxymuconolactone decarboxylase